MNSVITEMLNRYNAEGLTDKKNAVEEVMQEIVLCGLSRAGFFKKTYIIIIGNTVNIDIIYVPSK